MAESEGRVLKWHHIIPIACTIMGMIGGMLLNAYTIARNIASVEYVDTKAKLTSDNLTKYTDDQVGKARTEFTSTNQAMLDNFNSKFHELIDLNKATLDKANDHSDYNKKSMEVEYAGVSTGMSAMKESMLDLKREIEDMLRVQRRR